MNQSREFVRYDRNKSDMYTVIPEFNFIYIVL